MMGKKILFSGVLIAIFAGCNAGEDVQDFIDDTKKKYFKEEVAGVADDSGSVIRGEENDISISGQEQEMLDLHNSARREVGITNDLSWSATLAKDAKSYADTIANSGVWGHDPKNYGGYTNGPYGENLYTSTARPELKDAAEAWIKEKRYYTYGKVGDTNTCETGQICGHYTQIVWKKSSEVGCATSKYKRGEYKDWFVVVCKYKTAGNYIDETPY